MFSLVAAFSRLPLLSSTAVVARCATGSPLRCGSGWVSSRGLYTKRKRRATSPQPSIPQGWPRSCNRTPSVHTGLHSCWKIELPTPVRGSWRSKDSAVLLPPTHLASDSGSTLTRSMTSGAQFGLLAAHPTEALARLFLWQVRREQCNRRPRKGSFGAAPKPDPELPHTRTQSEHRVGSHASERRK